MLNSAKRFFQPKSNLSNLAGDVQYSKYGIGVRLTAAFSVVVILTVTISAISWFSLGNLTNAQSEMIDQRLPSISLALKLANETALLTAAAPQLNNAKTDSERAQNYKSIETAFNKAVENLEALHANKKGDATLLKISDNLKSLEANFNRLNDQVKKHIAFASSLGGVDTRMAEYRKILDTELNSLVMPLRLKIIENADDWNTLLDTSVRQALSGTQPAYDTSVLSSTGNSVLRQQENIFSFKSYGYLMIGLLSEGVQAHSVEAVQELETAFLSSISSMSSPLSEIEKATSEERVKKLSQLFDGLLAMGVDTHNSGNSVNVFKIKLQELEAIKASQSIISEGRFLAATLSKNVNGFVSEAEGSLGAASEANLRLANTTKVTLLACALGAMLIAIAIGWIYIRKNIIRRLMLLVASAQKLSEGDLESSIYREGRDEIARMGHALVGFRDTAREAEAARAEAEIHRQQRDEEKMKLADEQRKMEQSALEERERLTVDAARVKAEERNQLADSFEGSVKHLVEKFAAATSEMTTMSQSMTEMAENTTQRSATVASASDMASSSVNSVAAATEELSASINEISRQVNQAADIAGEAVSEAQRTNIMVNSLNEAASKIGDIVGLISDIAGQTNLLALNATIEAARAGAAGKGFAVVASEVKNLAAQTARATEEISEQIKAVQEETGNAVGAIGDITSTIGRINDVAASISAAVEQQGAATGEISRSIQQAAQGSLEVSQNIISLRDAASSTGKTALDVCEVSTEMVKEVSNLDKEVERFLSQIRTS
ncbi:methyl-accepting chemotaxis protein [Sneathiella sp.]|uniref:methyl-accepting chemotaxis protein n=1 Tax=Sneathiella sp. TaxID=1964365 RepID=UPI00356678ED